MAVVFYKGCGKTVSRDQQETWNKDARSGCEIYTRGCGRVSGENEEGEFFISDREQADMYNQWLSGDPPGIVCTTALSAGNDCRSVVFILIYEPFPDAIEIIQMAGRAMRSGLPCLVTIVPAPYLPELSADNDLRILRGYHPIAQILYMMPNWPVSRHDRCIRYVILKYNDGVGKRCFDVADAQLCVYCSECKSSSNLNSGDFELMNGRCGLLDS